MKSSDTEKQLRAHSKAILVDKCGKHTVCSNRDFAGGEAVCLGLIPIQKRTNWLNRTTWLIWDLETLLTEET